MEIMYTERAVYGDACIHTLRAADDIHSEGDNIH